MRHILLPLACMSLLIVEGLLLYRLHRYRVQLDSCVQAQGVRPGTPVTDLRGSDMDGKPVGMALAGHRRTILLVYSTQCRACDRNWPHWQSLLDRVGSRANIAIINLGATIPKAPLVQLPSQDVVLFARIDAASRQAYGFNSTPQTILVRMDGVVEQVWTGILNRHAVDEIVAAVGGATAAGL